MALRLACAAAVLLVGAHGAAAGELRGRVVLELPGLALSEAGPLVVYLEPADGAPVPEPEPTTAAVIRQKSARFSPDFLVVARGQTIEMPNDDEIYHNVFSYSAPNEFDLGLYAAGKRRTVRFRHAGVVRIYCSIHESMNGTIFVAPTPWYALADVDGRYAVRGAPPGRYRGCTWSERLPAISRSVEIGEDVATLDLSLGEARAR
jgi:plastocyanin